MSKTNFDSYLEENLRDPDFAALFAEAKDAWEAMDISLCENSEMINEFKGDYGGQEQ
ncbi:MAG: hypothetical protein WD595_03675 [Waddliaceae bacterium]